MDKDSTARRALVVDDEALIRWSIAETLMDQGIEVEQAGTGAAALEAVGASEKRFDFVFLDFRLPDSNDLKLLAQLRKLLPDSPVVLMTAFGTPDVVQGALDLGAARVMSKPFELSEVTAIVTRLQ